MARQKSLDLLDDDGLAVYVVWLPVLPGDDRQAAEKATAEIDDPRARHFWAADQTLGLAFGRTLPLPLARDLAWDIYLTFPAAARFEERVPAPERWFHQLGMDERYLGDGAGLTGALLDLLDAD